MQPIADPAFFKSLMRPLIFVDVNLAPGRSERITVFLGDTAYELASQFAVKHGLEFTMRQKLEVLLESQISELLERAMMRSPDF